jgi:prepilin-type N-terminal cleavage/methylation domain-containing protein
VRNSGSGFTLVEVLVALILLGIGIIAMAGSSGMVTRMIGSGKAETHAAQAASRRMEMLRLAAYSTSPRCIAAEFAGGRAVSVDGITESWVVPPTGKLRTVRVTVSYLTVRGARSAVLETAIEC